MPDFSSSLDMPLPNHKKESTLYYKEALELNKLIIKLKKEILKGNITVLTIEEIDEATIPTLNTLRRLKRRST